MVVVVTAADALVGESAATTTASRSEGSNGSPLLGGADGGAVRDEQHARGDLLGLARDRTPGERARAVGGALDGDHLAVLAGAQDEPAAGRAGKPGDADLHRGLSATDPRRQDLDL